MNSERLNILIDQLNLDGDDPFLIYGIAMEFLSSDQFEDALHYLKLGIKKYPDYLPSYYQMGLVLDQMNDVDGAIEVLKTGLILAKKIQNEKTAAEIQQYITNLELE